MAQQQNTLVDGANGVVDALLDPLAYRCQQAVSGVGMTGVTTIANHVVVSEGSQYPVAFRATERRQLPMSEELQTVLRSSAGYRQFQSRPLVRNHRRHPLSWQLLSCESRQQLRQRGCRHRVIDVDRSKCRGWHRWELCFVRVLHHGDATA